MDKQDIVLGGIYEFYDKQLGKAYPVIVKRIKDNNPEVKFPYGVAYLEPDELGIQIGYDATYSDEYKQTQKELDEYQKLKDACQLVIDHELAIYGIWTNQLLNVAEIAHKYDIAIQQLKAEIEIIKAKSWIDKETDNG